MLLSQTPVRADARDSDALIEAARYCDREALINASTHGGHAEVCCVLLSWPEHPARADAQDSAALIKASMYGGPTEVCRYCSAGPSTLPTRMLMTAKLCYGQ